MDRNTILAIALAMLILTLYQSIFVVPKRAQDLKKSQVTAVKEDVPAIPGTVVKNAPIQSSPTSASIKEEISSIETPNLNVEFSNVGGSLHNVHFKSDNGTLPLENMLTIKGLENASFALVSKDASRVSYLYNDAEWKILKTYSVADKNSIKAKFEISHTGSRLEEPSFRLININAGKQDLKNNRNTMLEEFSILEGNKVTRKGNAYKFNTKDNKTANSKIEWAGYRDHYHAFVVKPEFETKVYDREVLGDNQMAFNVTPKEAKTTYEFTIVSGYQDIEWLKTYHQKFEKIVAFSSFWLIDIVAKAVYYTIPVLHSICRSWGFSIILISLIIYGITYPLTMKSMSSMRKMQLVQPKVAALQKRYKEDPAKLNAEMVDLYKKEGVNPLGGCLPFLLQMPVFMALYQILWRAYYFQGKSYLWMKDLALPDRLFILPFDLPFLGNEFNILPILMAAVMFLQQSVSAKNMVVTDETQAMQQKMMRYIFPFFIGFIFYKFASGLSLYFTVFYALSTWTQWKIANTGTVQVAKIK